MTTLLNGSPPHLASSPASGIDREHMMLPPLLRWLTATGHIRSRTTVALEIPWQGRRIDLGLSNSRGLTSAFELKLGSIQRAIEQAYYNRAGFHRSWIVTGNAPREHNLHAAVAAGLGLILVKDDTVSLLARPTHGPPSPKIARAVRAAIHQRQVTV